jgi:hypothetical protein
MVRVLYCWTNGQSPHTGQILRVLKCEFILIPTGIKWYWGNPDLILRETLILRLEPAARY